MISYLHGKVINKAQNYAIVEVGSGIGYQVYVGENFLNEMKISGDIEIYTHHQVREDASDLYGFKSLEELGLFELLLTVSGVGPKSALGVISLASAGEIKEAIVRGDANLLSKVSGIGKKTAERLVLELKTKVLRIGGGQVISADYQGLSGSDEIDALMSLGYSLNDARAALNLIDPGITDSGERVKAALRKMAKS